MPSENVMKEFKSGELRSGSPDGPKVKNRKQAVAILLSEKRKEGKSVPSAPVVPQSGLAARTGSRGKRKRY